MKKQKNLRKTLSIENSYLEFEIRNKNLKKKILKNKNRVVKSPDKNKRLTNLKKSQKTKKLISFSKLKTALNTIFFSFEQRLPKINFNPKEKKIIFTILQRKKIISTREEETNATLENLELPRSYKKKVENELKFVFTRTVKFLQNEFKVSLGLKRAQRNLPKKTHISAKRLNELFYSQHFGEISRETKIPLENFYHFQSRNKMNSELIPKSVTRKSLYFWKMNPDFVRKVSSFISQKLWRVVEESNGKKVQNILDQWEYMTAFYGQDDGFVEILEWFDKPGLKLPWTKIEVDLAIRTALEHLK